MWIDRWRIGRAKTKENIGDEEAACTCGYTGATMGFGEEKQ